MGSKCDQNSTAVKEKDNSVENVQVDDLQALIVISAWTQLSSNHQEKFKHS